MGPTNWDQNRQEKSENAYLFLTSKLIVSVSGKTKDT